jgi:hypothetical protein
MNGRLQVRTEGDLNAVLSPWPGDFEGNVLATWNGVTDYTGARCTVEPNSAPLVIRYGTSGQSSECLSRGQLAYTWNTGTASDGFTPVNRKTG